MDGDAHQPRHLRVRRLGLKHQSIAEDVGHLDALTSQNGLHTIDDSGRLAITPRKFLGGQELAEIDAARAYRRGHDFHQVITVGRLQGDGDFDLLIVGRRAQIGGRSLCHGGNWQQGAKGQTRRCNGRVPIPGFDQLHQGSPRNTLGDLIV